MDERDFKNGLTVFMEEVSCRDARHQNLYLDNFNS